MSKDIKNLLLEEFEDEDEKRKKKIKERDLL